MDELSPRKPRTDPAMPALVGVLLFCVVYTVTYLLRIAPGAYLPLECRWAVTAPPGAVAIRYYGHLVLSLVAWIAGYALASIPPVTVLLSRPRLRGALGAVTTLAAFASIVAVMLYELRHWLPR